MARNNIDIHAHLHNKLAAARQQVAFWEEALEAYTKGTLETMPENKGLDVDVACATNDFFHVQGLLPIDDNAPRQTMLDILEIGALQWDKMTGNVITSMTWNSWFGAVEYNQENPLKTISTRIDPRDLHFVTTQLHAFLQSEESCKRLTLRIPNKGKQLWIEVAFIALRGQNNTLLKLNCFGMDMTYFKEKELFFKKELNMLNDARIGFPSVSLHVSSQLIITQISPGAYHYIDVNPENLKNIPLGIFFDPPSYAFIQQEVANVLRTQEPSKCKVQLTFYNNTTISAIIQFWPLKATAGGKGNSVNILIWDTQSTHYLVENFYTLFNNLVDGFILVQSLPTRHKAASSDSEAFTAIVMNPALANMYDADFRQYVGQSLQSLVGQDYEQWEICLQQVVQHKKPVVYCMKSKEKPMLLEISAFSSGLDSIGCIIKNVTALHAAEQAMLLNEARTLALYRLSYMYSLPIKSVLGYALAQMIQLTESQTGMIAFYDVDSGNYELWSQGPSERVVRKNVSLEELERIEGFHQIRLPGVTLEPFIVDKVKEPFVCSNGKQALRYMIAPITEEDKLVCLARVSNKSIPYAEGDLRQLELFLSGAWLHLRRRWARDFLQKAKDQAEAANQAKDMFLANVSHELRTPLNGILGMLQLLQQSALEKEQQEWVQVAVDSGRGLMRIISDILDIARIEASQYEVVATTFNLPASIQSTLSIFTHKALQKQIAFTIDIDSNIPPAIVGDETLLRQIILNLIGNAFKFTNTGKISFECNILPIAHDNTIYLYMGIHDTGIGVPDDKIPNIYKAFTQLDSSLTRKHGGVGLGLSIVSHLVSVMNGSLCIDSVVGEGTSFHLSLPFKVGKASDISSDISSSVAVFQDKLSILAVEDDPVNQFTIKTMLQKMGHTVVCVGNGVEALNILQRQNFQCIITDIQMPVMDGGELITRIRNGNFSGIQPSSAVTPDATLSCPEFNRAVPIIALSAHVMADLEKHFVDHLGANYYLEKPINIHKLANILQEIGTR